MQIREKVKTTIPESNFDRALEQELLSFGYELANILNRGLTVKDNFLTQAQSHIADADGTLADLTTKFNTLLGYLETHGLIASS